MPVRPSPPRRAPAPGTVTLRISPLRAGVLATSTAKIRVMATRAVRKWNAVLHRSTGSVAAVLPHFATGQLHPPGALHSRGHTGRPENGSGDLLVCNYLMLAAAICGSVEPASVLRYAHHLATAVRNRSAASVIFVVAQQPRRRWWFKSLMSEVLLHRMFHKRNLVTGLEAVPKLNIVGLCPGTPFTDTSPNRFDRLPSSRAGAATGSRTPQG